jgi:hypothetical protein
LQGVGECDTCGVHVDEDLAFTAGLVDLDDVRRLWTIEAGYLYRAHRTI